MARPRKGWSVFYRGDKRRWVCARDGKQKLLPREIKNKREAVVWATKWLTENGYLEDDGTAKRQDQTNLVEDIADRWIEWRITLIGKQWEPATVSNNRSHVDCRIKPGLGKFAISSCTPRVIAAWLQSLTDAPNTIRNLYRTVVAMFDDCIEQGFCDLELNPARSAIVAKAVPESLTRAQEVQADTELTIQQLQTVTSYPRVPLERRVKYTCAATLVARDGEVMGLSWGAVDFDAGTVRIFQSAKIRRFSTDPSVGKPKTRRGRRTVPLHSAAKAALFEWRVALTCKLGHEPSKTSPVFPGRDGKSFTRVKAAAQFRDDLVTCGLPDTASGVNLVFHHLRHTALNILRRAKVEPLVRDYLAGHAPSSVGDGSYQHGTMDELRVDIERIPLVWAGARGSFDAGLCASVTETEKEGLDDES